MQMRQIRSALAPHVFSRVSFVQDVDFAPLHEKKLVMQNKGSLR